MNVLVCESQGITSEIQFDNAKPYLPYVWAVLKSYYERHGKEPNAVNWLDPIWRNDLPARLFAPYSDQRTEVLGLSCYTWNWKVQCGIAELAKKQNPDCLVVAGGPEPDYKDPEFFRQHPYIDMVVVKDGEVTFSAILDRVLTGSRDFTDIGGLYLPSEQGPHIMTGTAELPSEFPYSPYVEQNEYYDRLLSGYPEGSFDAIVETNRGCPYSCSFCDWGSNTNSKVRRFDMERIATEVDWIGRKKVSGVMLADANFGILPRDPDIADLFNASKQQHEGYPQHIFWSAAKNNPDRVISIAKKFSSSGICTSHALSIQHTRKEVLAATQRSNISAAKQVEVTKAMMAVDVPIEVQLILGIPGDTYELWKGCLADLMEWGIHEDYLIQAYRLLPNAPAADPAFMESWRIETVERVMHDWIVRDVNAPVSDIPQKPEQVVVSSRTFDREDWVRMSTYSAFVKAFHNAALLQRVAVYLRLTHGISYLDFYQGLIEEFARSSVLATRWYDEVASHYREFLVREDASDHMEIHEMPQLTVALHPSRWIFIQACLEIDKFYAAVKDYLVGRWLTIANLPGVIDYQRELVIHPSYDSATGKGFRAEVDWPGYFAVTRGRVGSESLAEPEAVPGAVIQVSDTTSGERVNSAYESSGTGFYGNPLEWGDGDEAARWAAWVERTVIGRSSAGMNNLQQLRLKSGG